MTDSMVGDTIFDNVVLVSFVSHEGFLCGLESGWSGSWFMTGQGC